MPTQTPHALHAHSAHNTWFQTRRLSYVYAFLAINGDKNAFGVYVACLCIRMSPRTSREQCAFLGRPFVCISGETLIMSTRAFLFFGRTLVCGSVKRGWESSATLLNLQIYRIAKAFSTCICAFQAQECPFRCPSKMRNPTISVMDEW